MKPKQPISSFNLPVLLSFNELAWIGIFAMGLACLYAWRQNEEIPGLRQTVELQGRQLAALTNFTSTNILNAVQITNRVIELVRTNGQLELLLAQERRETARLKGLLEKAQAALMVTNEKLAEQQKEIAQLTDRLQRTTATNAALAKANLDLRNELAEGKIELAKLNREIAEAGRAIESLTAQLAKAREKVKDPTAVPLESEIRQEILGLKGGAANGSFSNVVMLLDRSGSMSEGEGRRWRDAVGVVSTWITHLPISHCAVLVFDHECESILTNAWIDVRGPEGRKNRDRLVAAIKAIEPRGSTDTHLALSNALNYHGIDTVILFTDGKPERTVSDKDRVPTGSKTSGTIQGLSPYLMEEVLKLCEERNPRIPVNTVGIGNYFDNDLGKFLRDIAARTGGTFIGR